MAQRGAIVALAVLTVVLLAGCSVDWWSVSFYSVDRVISRGDVLYARLVVKNSRGMSGADEDEGTEHFYASRDGGIGWAESKPPEGVIRSFDTAVTLPLTACAAGQPGTCYRITGTSEIELSEDGGQMWRTGWRMSPGRQAYMARQSAFSGTLGIEPDVRPFDLAVLETVSGPAMVAAMGNQGVLVRTAEGAWKRVAVAKATPVPYRAESLEDLQGPLRNENRTTGGLTVLLSVVLCLSGWMTIRSRLAECDPAITRQILILGVVMLLVPMLSGLAVVLLAGDALCLPVWLISAGSIAIGWLWLAGRVPDRKAAIKAFWACLYCSVILFLGTWLPFVLWAFGAIALYELAQGLALLLGALMAAWSLLHERRLARRACEG